MEVMLIKITTLFEAQKNEEKWPKIVKRNPLTLKLDSGTNVIL